MSELPSGLRGALGELVNTYMREPAEEDAATQRVLQLAVKHLACDAASISMCNGDRPLVTVACTDPVVECAERLQHALGEGPILDSLSNQTDLVAELRAEARWPNWAKAAIKLGLTSVVTMRLADWSDGNDLLNLNLYSSSPRPVTRDEFDIARHFAREAALAMHVNHEIWHLNRAIKNRTVIGQAEGLMMERFQIDADRAFALLKRISSQTNRKLHAIATDIVHTGELPSSTEPRADAQDFQREEQAIHPEQNPAAHVP